MNAVSRYQRVSDSMSPQDLSIEIEPDQRQVPKIHDSLSFSLVPQVARVYTMGTLALVNVKQASDVTRHWAGYGAIVARGHRAGKGETS